VKTPNFKPHGAYDAIIFPVFLLEGGSSTTFQLGAGTDGCAFFHSEYIPSPFLEACSVRHPATTVVLVSPFRETQIVLFHR
jgi:hypothetical protein